MKPEARLMATRMAKLQISSMALATTIYSRLKCCQDGFDLVQFTWVPDLPLDRPLPVSTEVTAKERQLWQTPRG